MQTAAAKCPCHLKKRAKSAGDRKCAYCRLKSLKRRFEKDKKYHMDYLIFMSETITHGDAEKVPENEVHKTPVWYIPHHGVYHPQKPGKIRVVFDCSAKFEGVSLNEHLLTGPELTNTLILCKRGKERAEMLWSAVYLSLLSFCSLRTA